MPHFHINIEIFIVKKGKYDVVCNGKTYALESGSVAFFDSYDMHSYIKSYASDVDDCVLIIPPRFIQTYATWKRNRVVSCPVINDSKLANTIIEIIDNLLPISTTDYTKQATANLILSFIHEKLTYEHKQAKDNCALIREILTYIYDNFKSDISLSKLSKNFGYTKEHLSRTFHEYIKMSIPTYINGLRVEYVLSQKRKDNTKNITHLIFEAGFKSIQSFYRNKSKSITGVSFETIKNF